MISINQNADGGVNQKPQYQSERSECSELSKKEEEVSHKKCNLYNDPQDSRQHA